MKYRIVREDRHYRVDVKLFLGTWQPVEMCDMGYRTFDSVQEAERYIERQLQPKKDVVIREYK